MAIPTIDLFTDNETPNAAKMNQARQALITALAGALTGDNIGWPLVCQGDIDMNGNTFYNTTSADGVQHVNASLSLANAVTNAAANGKTIVIDPGYTATANGITVSEDDITIMGYGKDSKIECTTSAGTGMTVTGSNFTMKNLDFSGNATPTEVTTLLATSTGSGALVDGVHFGGSAASAISAGQENAIITKCNFDSGTNGVLLALGSTATVVASNIFDDCPYPVIGTGISGTTFLGNACRSTTTFSTALDDIAIVSNVFTGGLTMSLTAGAAMFNNNMVNNAMTVSAGADLATFNGNSISGNLSCIATANIEVAFGNALYGTTAGFGTAVGVGGTSSENYIATGS